MSYVTTPSALLVKRLLQEPKEEFLYLVQDDEALASVSRGLLKTLLGEGALEESSTSLFLLINFNAQERLLVREEAGALHLGPRGEVEGLEEPLRSYLLEVYASLEERLERIRQTQEAQATLRREVEEVVASREAALLPTGAEGTPRAFALLKRMEAGTSDSLGLTVRLLPLQEASA